MPLRLATLLRLVAALVLLWIVGGWALRAVARPAAEHPWFAARPGQHQPLVFAHQGGENVWPSNTLLAFREADALGADVLDADMHMTRDGVLVLMHDETVERTTDGSGAIRDLTLAQIKALDAGHDFSPDGGQRFPYRAQGLQVPTVEELVRAFPDGRFGIEIKQSEPDKTARLFCALIRQYGMQDQLLVSSFRQVNMDAFRRECPEVATSATQQEVTWFYALHRVGLADPRVPLYQSLQVPERSGSIHLLTPAFVAEAHRRGLAVQPWSINEEEAMRRILALGVDGINTDNPDRLIPLVGR